MIQEAITDQLTGMVPDLIAVAAAFLVGMIIMRSFKQMAYAAEFDKQYKIAAGNASKSGDKSFFNIDNQAWKKEYIANRSGGVKRQIQQKRQRAAFNYSRPGSSPINSTAKTQKSNPSQKPKTNTIVRELKGFKQIKSRYGISNQKALLSYSKLSNGKRPFMTSARPYQQRELNAGRDPQTYKQFREELQGKKFVPTRFDTNTGKTLANIRSSRDRNGKVFS